MNWEAIGAIGEIIGALAVVVTLGYLAVQTRHNSKIAHSSIELELRRNFSSMNELLLSDPVVSELAGNLTDPNFKIDESNKVAIEAFAIRQFHNWGSANIAYKNGMLSKESWRLLYINEVPRIIGKYPALMPVWDKFLSIAAGELDEETTYLRKNVLEAGMNRESRT